MASEVGRRRGVAQTRRHRPTMVDIRARAPLTRGLLYTHPMRTPVAKDASVVRSPGSDVGTVLFGSPSATTMASTAEPRRAFVHSQAARRATGSGSAPTTSQAFKSWLTRASRRPWPVRDSTSTALGTTGGQRPSRRSAESRARPDVDRSESRLNARSPGGSRSACGPRRPSLDASSDGVRPRPFLGRWLYNLLFQARQVAVSLLR
jgi:hypothetical protein